MGYSVVLHNGCMDRIAGAYPLRAVLLEHRYCGLYIGCSDRKHLRDEPHYILRHIHRVGIASQRTVAVEDFLDEFCIDHDLHPAGSDITHQPLAGVTVGVRRAGRVHRYGRIEHRGYERRAHLLDRSPNNLLFHLVPISDRQIHGKKPLKRLVPHISG